MASVSSLLGGIQLCFHGNFKAPRPSSPSSEGLLLPQETQVYPREVPSLYPGGAVVKLPSIVFAAWWALSPRDRLTLSIDKTLGYIASGPAFSSHKDRREAYTALNTVLTLFTLSLRFTTLVWGQWNTPIIPAFRRRQRQEDYYRFKASLGYLRGSRAG